MPAALISTPDLAPAAAPASPGTDPAGTAPRSGAAVSPADVSRWLARGEAALIDVREPDEHARERIAGARLIPLATLAPAALPNPVPARLVLHCKSGRRSQEGVARLRAHGIDALTMTGGIDAWRAAGLPVERNPAAPIPIMRQVQIVVGAALLIGTALTGFVSPWFLIVPAFFGAGLLFAGVTGTCALAILLGAMPWNRAAAPAPASPPASCPIPPR